MKVSARKWKQRKKSSIGIMKHIEIKLEGWEREHLFNYYLHADMPYIIISANVDVTNAYRFAKENNLSFNLVMVYLANRAADSIKNFRYRMKDGKPFEIEYNIPVINHLKPGTDIFVAAAAKWPADDIAEFCKDTHERFFLPENEDFTSSVTDKYDIINYSTIPWIQYTHFFRTVIKCGEDNNPKLSFGKYFHEGDRIMMPVSSQTHHGLMDGHHVGMFYERLQESICGLPTTGKITK